ncbi:MAG TPA: LLM class flavin-dependent oxidoreductase [Nitrososphaerales archaeon]|nr:LLM class flavin-dependent oxidoreductase [Nitrososphaerales archaeon]
MGIGFNADLPVTELVRKAQFAEGLGYDSFWMHEHSFGRDAISFLSSISSNTSRIKLGAACLSPYTRHPVVLAMSMLTLQESSSGRAILGLGSGFPARLDLLGINHERPIGTIRETIEICRTLWSGDALSYSGRNFSLKGVKSIAGKAHSKIPVYIAGWKKQMLALAGRYADGYVAKGGESIHSIRQITSSIEASASKWGRRLSDIDISAYLLTYVGGSKEEALGTARRDPFVNYMLSVQDDYLYEGTGIDPAKKKPIAENYFKGDITASSSFITDEMLEAFTLVGTGEQVCDRVQEFKKSGLNLPILQPISMKAQDIDTVLRAGAMLIGEDEKGEYAATQRAPK